jgi:peroxiredoxin
MEYNYARFKTTNYDYAKFPGPKAGDSMLDFPMTKLDGTKINLSDYKGQWVVIETGSLTCPMFVKNINPIKKLRAKYPDVAFLVVYVREAHPGSRTNAHQSMDDKIACAKETQQAYGDDRETLVDDLLGSMHQAYGSFPNMTYVIDPEGTVVFRCDWAFAHLIEEVLENRPNLNPNERKQIISAAPWIMIPVCLKGGWDALWDLVVALPGILWGHLKVDVARMMGKSPS